MKYYDLCPHSSRAVNWILFRDQMPEDIIEVRPLYADMACPRCRKLDERAAIRRGIEPQVRIKASKDFTITDDNFNCLSRRAQDVLETAGVKGLGCIKMPGDKKYSIIMPECVVKVDRECWSKCFEYGKPCEECGRPSEMTGLPSLECFTPPEDPWMVFTTDLVQDSGYAASQAVYVSEVVRDVIKRLKLSGLAPFWEL